VYQAYLIGSAAILAQASFSNTIGLGSVLIGIMIVIGFAWASRKDKRSERWEQLYNLASTERQEVQAKLDEAMGTVTEQKTVINKLDALQMPVRIVEMMNTSVERIDDAANRRLTSAMEKVMEGFRLHEEQAEARDARAQERHEASMELMADLVKAVTQLSISVDEQ